MKVLFWSVIFLHFSVFGQGVFDDDSSEKINVSHDKTFFEGGDPFFDGVSDVSDIKSILQQKETDKKLRALKLPAPLTSEAVRDYIAKILKISKDSGSSRASLAVGMLCRVADDYLEEIILESYDYDNKGESYALSVIELMAREKHKKVIQTHYIHNFNLLWLLYEKKWHFDIKESLIFRFKKRILEDSKNTSDFISDEFTGVYFKILYDFKKTNPRVVQDLVDYFKQTRGAYLYRFLEKREPELIEGMIKESWGAFSEDFSIEKHERERKKLGLGPDDEDAFTGRLIYFKIYPRYQHYIKIALSHGVKEALVKIVEWQSSDRVAMDRSCRNKMLLALYMYTDFSDEFMNFPKWLKSNYKNLIWNPAKKKYELKK